MEHLLQGLHGVDAPDVMGISEISKSRMVKRVIESPDVKSAHIEGKDTRNGSGIRLNVSREKNRKIG